MSKEQAITEWVGLYGDDLYRWAFSKTHRQELAEDLVQETFLAALEGFEQFRHASSPKTYLMAILKNKAAAHFKKQYKSGEQFAKAIEAAESMFSHAGHWAYAPAPHDYENVLDNPEFMSQLTLCMNNLPLQWQQAVQSKFLLEKSGEEVCAMLSLTPANYWQIMRRAKLLLKKCIDFHWFNC
jgi:RNA polymerase sigma-70 factor (ECF subfamily)